jgi:aldose 1-epimerase
MPHRIHAARSALGALAIVLAAQAAPGSGAARAADYTATVSGIRTSLFGRTKAGEEVLLYRLTNSHGMEVAISPLGATVVSISVPDRNGVAADVVLGFDSLEGYLGSYPYFGATVGRYGNRIAKGRFRLDGKEYVLATNNGANHLHGGGVGFDKRLWTAHEVSSKAGPGVELHYTSADGEEGYPGKLEASVTYTLTESNELRIEYHATTDKPTIVNLTNHSYFNLAGQGNPAGKGDVLGHVVQIKAARFTPIDAGFIPTGEIRSVKGTAFDFTTPHTIGERIGAKDEQLTNGKGYDHNWLLDGPAGKLRVVARVSEPTSGRVMEVLTTEPGLQFYSGNFLDGTNVGKGNTIYAVRSGFCMETQHYPDSPNEARWPSTTLRPGHVYRSTTVYRFSAS